MSIRLGDQLPAKRHSLASVETYEVERYQFDDIEREATSIGTAFAIACACVPLALSLTVTLKTVSISDPKTAIPVWGLTWACYLIGAGASIDAYRKRGQLKRFMQQIRERQLAPVAAKEGEPDPDLTASTDPESGPSESSHPNLKESV